MIEQITWPEPFPKDFYIFDIILSMIIIYAVEFE